MLHKFSAAVLLVMLVVFSNCSKSSSYGSNPGSGTTTGTTTINIQSMAFSPSNLSVTAGTTVKWTNNDGMTHTVTSNDGASFDSGNLGAGSSFSHTFSAAGTFPYHCTIHSSMTGTITVTP